MMVIYMYMALNDESKRIIENEADIRPNRYSVYALLGTLIVLLAVFILNEIGIFEISLSLVRISYGIVAALYLLLVVLLRNEKIVADHRTKYFVMSIVLIITLVLLVLLNINAVLVLLLPMMLATQYRSRKIAILAMAGTVIICALSPLLSLYFRTFSYKFLSGYIETVCDVHIESTSIGLFTKPEEVGRLLLYLVLPQELVVTAFGAIMFSIVENGISSLENQISVLELRDGIDKELQKQVELKDRILYSMSEVIESRDFSTGGHVKRTSHIVELLVKEMLKQGDERMDEHLASLIIKAAPLHDIGKIVVPDEILNKQGKLTDEEFLEIKKHAEKSGLIIQKTFTEIEDKEQLDVAINVAQYHHERYDGSGYSWGLHGEDIPIEARIMAIADVYDALVTERVYKKPLSFEEAYQIIVDGMGSQFDPSLCQYFIACREDIEQYYRNSGS